MGKEMVIILEHYFTNNENLKSELRTISYEVNNVLFSFTSDNGVFSKDKIDFGSLNLVKVLLKNYPKKNINALDVGCGYGFIGISLAKLLDSKFDMVDVNNRAIHLANMNIKNNKVEARAFYSDALSGIDKNYDLIVTNPPIRAGKVVVEKILLDSLKHLNSDGELWFVIRKDQGAKSIINLLKTDYEVTLVEKCKGFYVIKAKNVDKAR